MKSIRAIVEEEGISLTPQRLAIIDFMEGNRTHPTVDEIYQDVKSMYPTISKATVYSTMQLLCELGAVQELSIRKRGEACFDPRENKHQHFLCRKCNRVIDISVDLYDEEDIIKAIDSRGHRVEDVHSYFYGVCSDCIQSK
ncbi:MAG: transcriptional repressor [Candidatus Latescibacteria bacterium]|nr:transcriptional repressor [bacterium]MBD3424612.1 transcriptional repressor [Candidatus Latescibacterota bacterium]